MSCGHRRVVSATSNDWQFMCADCSYMWGDLTKPNADPKLKDVNDVEEWAAISYGESYSDPNTLRPGEDCDDEEECLVR